MSCSTTGVRLGLAAAVTLLLVSGSACSADNQPGPSASPTLPVRPGSSTSASAPTAAPESTPVTPSTPGAGESTVQAKPERSRKAVDIDAPSTTGTGLTARLTSIRAIQAKAQVPGEVAGPALAISIDVKNTGSRPVVLDSVVVNLADSDKAPGGEMSAPPANPLGGTIAPGRTAKAVYVFTVPKNKRNPVTVTVTLGDAPVLVFTGKA